MSRGQSSRTVEKIQVRPYAFSGKITICVCVTSAQSLPSPRVMRVCQTMVVRPLVQRCAFGVCGVAGRNDGEEVGLALDRRGAPALGQVCHRGGAAEIVGERHDRAAMQRAVAVGQFLAHRQFGGDLVGRHMRDLDAEEIGERRLQFGVGIHSGCPQNKGAATSRALTVQQI